MTTENFIKKWIYSRITVSLNDIPHDSSIFQFKGTDAWTKLMSFYPPRWDQGDDIRSPFDSWFNSNNYMYKRIITEETNNGQVERYRSGLPNYEFCAISDGKNGVVVDGAHRFIILKYLKEQGQNIDKEIEKIELDVLVVANLKAVLKADAPENR